MLRRSLVPLAVLLLGGVLPSCEDEESPAQNTNEPVFEVGAGGARVRVTLEPFGVEILDNGGGVVLATTPAQEAYGAAAGTFDDFTVAPALLPGWDGYKQDEQPWRSTRKARVTARTATSASLVADGEGVSVTYEVAVNGARVSLKMKAEPTAGATTINKTAMAFSSPSDEHFFGMGERYASTDHRGFSLYSWAEEGAIGKGENFPIGPNNPSPNGPSMTYFPVPFFLSTKGYGVHLATTFRTELHFASERPDAWRAAANATGFEAVIYVNKNPLDTLDAFTQDTGRPMLPAPWVFGLRRRVGVNAKVGDDLEYVLMRKKKIPCTGIDDAVHFLPALSHVGREDELAQWTKDLHAFGYKAMAYNNPYVASNDPAAAADYAFGKEHGYFIKGPDGEPDITFFISGKPLDIAAVDLTNPDAVAWFQGLLKRTLDLGYDGWMHDFGEYVPRDAVLFDGRRGDEFHNEFPVRSAKAAHDLMERERPGDYLFFVRSGGAGTQAFTPAVWGGDAEATFDEVQGLPSAVRGGVNLSATGVPYWGSDMTGFKCLTSDPKDKDVFLRWVELGAVSPIMMEQNACSNPVSTTKPTKWSLWKDDETIEVYRRWASFHTRLAPYFWVLAARAHEKGVPITMHPFLVHPEESGGYNVDDSFWVGPALYAAPVVRRARTTRELWLPSGRFLDLDDGRPYTGGARVTVDAPLGKLPIFLAENQILPLFDSEIDTLAPATDESVVTPAKVADRLDVQVALGPSGKATLTLTDGTVLEAERLGSDGGNPKNLTEVPEDQLASCEGCFLNGTRQGLTRVRASSPNASSSELTIGALRLSAKGGPSRRIRWDVTLF